MAAVVSAEKFIKAYNTAHAKGKVLDVSELNADGSGYRSVDYPKTDKGKKKWVAPIPVISNSFEKYSLAMSLLGPQFAPYAAQFPRIASPHASPKRLSPGKVMAVTVTTQPLVGIVLSPLGGKARSPARRSPKKPKTPKSPKKPKTPKAPKTPRAKSPKSPKVAKTGYQLFTQEIRPAVVAANPTANIGQISKLVSLAWNGLNEAQKAAYNNRVKVAVAAPTVALAVIPTAVALPVALQPAKIDTHLELRGLGTSPKRVSPTRVSPKRTSPIIIPRASPPRTGPTAVTIPRLGGIVAVPTVPTMTLAAIPAPRGASPRTYRN